MLKIVEQQSTLVVDQPLWSPPERDFGPVDRVQGLDIYTGKDLYEWLFPDTTPINADVAKAKGEKWAKENNAFVLVAQPTQADINKAKKDGNDKFLILNLTGRYGMY